MHFVRTDTVLQLTICHMAVSHLSRPMGESSMIVPVFKVNCGAACFSRQCQRLYFSKNRTLSLPHFGQVTPLGQRRATKYSRQLTGSAKNTMASCRVLGSRATSMLQFLAIGHFYQVYYRPNKRPARFTNGLTGTRWAVGLISLSVPSIISPL